MIIASASGPIVSTRRLVSEAAKSTPPHPVAQPTPTRTDGERRNQQGRQIHDR